MNEQEVHRFNYPRGTSLKHSSEKMRIEIAVSDENTL
jgi:hypothetical protein